MSENNRERSMKTTKNPFTLDPVRLVEQFFGRQRITRQVLNELANGQHVSIVGPNGIGKTSFLYHVADPQVRAQNMMAEELVFVYVDGGALAAEGQETAGNATAWYQAIEEATLAQIGETIQDRPGLQARFEESLPDNGSATPDARVEKLFQVVMMRDIRPVLILDDFEELALSPRMDEHFLNVLRSLHTDAQVTYLVASLLPLRELEQVTSIYSVFFNMFLLIGSPTTDCFGSLDPTESRALVQTPLDQSEIKLDKSIIDYILELGENRPYSLKRAGLIAVDLWLSDPGMEPESHRLQIGRQFRLA